MRKRTRIDGRTVYVASLLVFAFISFGAAQAKQCIWTVTGKLTVAPELRELQVRYGDIVNLSGVQVRLSGRQRVAGKWATYAPWGTVRTNKDGEFRFVYKKTCGQRQLRLKVKFDDKNLEIRHARSTSSATKVKWYTVTGDITRNAGTWNAGELRFRTNGQGSLGTLESRRHAQIWVVYQDAIRWLNAQGTGFGFRTKVKVKYPHDGDVAPEANEASYTNPTTKVIYIVRNSRRDQFATDTLLHELGHQWAYNHSRGEMCLTMAIIGSGNTHGRVANPCVAFHEGFAEYFSEQMLSNLWYRPPRWRLKPFSRTYLRTGGNWGTPIINRTDYERSDVGWRSFFHMVSTGWLRRFTFNPPASSINARDPRTWVIQSRPPQGSRCHTPSKLLTFKQVLRTFEPGGGVDSRLSKSDMTIRNFLLRASKIHAHVSTADRTAFQILADPASSREPWQRLVRCRDNL